MYENYHSPHVEHSQGKKWNFLIFVSKEMFTFPVPEWCRVVKDPDRAQFHGVLELARKFGSILYSRSTLHLRCKGQEIPFYVLRF